MKIIEVELLVKDAEEEVGPRVQARACARTDALGVGDSSSTMIWSMSTSSIGSPRHVIRSRRSASGGGAWKATQTLGSTVGSWVRAARRHVREIQESLIIRSADHQDAIH